MLIDNLKMETATVSSKYQIVIPRKIREALHVKPGQSFYVIPIEGRIEFIPKKSIRKMRGFLKGMDTSVEREENRI